MSRDLFAAFGGSESTAQSSQTSRPANLSTAFFEVLPEPEQLTTQDVVDDDEWGDFEGAEAEERGSETEIAKLTVEAVSIQSPTAPKVTSSAETSNASRGNVLERPVRREPRDPNVLFDADEDIPSSDDEEDDFGQFEGTPVPESTAEPTAPVQEVDLLGLADVSLPARASASIPPKVTPSKPSGSLIDLDDLMGPNSPPDAILDTRNATKKGHGNKQTTPPSTVTNSFPLSFSTANTENQQPKQQPSLNSKEAVEDEDPWDDFTENIAEPSNAESSQPFNIPKAPPPPTELPNAQPPTNIPPPAILLSLFPALLTDISTAFFQPLSAQPAPTRHRIYADPQTTTYLKSYLALATVCARILAGRKARWKRDNLLSQSMRIGPAAGGGGGGSAGAKAGMKVAAVDRAEAQREDREAADVLRAWRALVGRVRGAVAEVRKADGGKPADARKDAVALVVPEIRDVMPVKSVGTREGGGVGERPCALCGLKREERVDKVDVEVFDGFGEWWIDDMNMHRACRNFWLEHEGKLRQR